MGGSRERLTGLPGYDVSFTSSVRARKVWWKYPGLQQSEEG